MPPELPAELAFPNHSRPSPLGKSCMPNSKPLTADTSATAPANAAVQSALRTLDAEGSGVVAVAAALNAELGDAFARAADLVRNAKGRLIVTGLGKSGLIGRKIAATFASTGTPAFFVHAAEAGHGDLGMITTEDVIIESPVFLMCCDPRHVMVISSFVWLPVLEISAEARGR